MTKLVFWYHYNKPASKAAAKPKLTVHFKGKCRLVDHVICGAATYTEHRKRQPHCVVRGKASQIMFLGDKKYGEMALIFV